MTQEDSSWSSASISMVSNVSEFDGYIACEEPSATSQANSGEQEGTMDSKLENPDIGTLLRALSTEMAAKDELITSFQNQLEAIKEEKEAAVNLLRATLRTETLLDKIDKCKEKDIFETIETIVARSRCLHVPELTEKAIKFAMTVLDRKPALAVSILAACNGAGALKGTDIEEAALAKIRTNPEMLLESEVMSHFNAARLKKIMKDPAMQATEYTMFRILATWKDAATASDDLFRLEVASKLVTHIALDLIDPCLLATEIRGSPFVFHGQLLDAYAKQAPFVKVKMPFEKKRAFGAFVWKKSKTEFHTQKENSGVFTNTDSIEGLIMTSGVYKWSIRVLKKGRTCPLFGIVEASSGPMAQHLGSVKGSWSFDGNYKYIAGTHVTLPKLTESIDANSIVTMTLSLNGRDGNLLEASINGCPRVTLFRGADLQDDGSGFVPAASISGGDSIQFLGFD